MRAGEGGYELLIDDKEQMRMRESGLDAWSSPAQLSLSIMPASLYVAGCRHGGLVHCGVRWSSGQHRGR